MKPPTVGTRMLLALFIGLTALIISGQADADTPLIDEPGAEHILPPTPDTPPEAKLPAPGEPTVKEDEPGLSATTVDEPAIMPPTKGKLRLKDGAKWHLLGHGLALPAYFILMTTMHEGSHALTATMAGVKVTSFKPYPHMENLGDGERFVMGSFSAEGELSDTGLGFTLAAPLIWDVTLFTASDLMLEYAVNRDSAAAPFLLVGGMICPLADFLYNINGISDGNDTNRLVKLTGVHKAVWVVVGDLMAAVAVWRILHHGKRIFFTDEPEKVTSSPIITPALGPQYAGMALTWRF